MKKIKLALLVLAIGSCVFSSCKTHERCPAYGSTVHPTSKKAV
jgi:hypothetical protein